MNGFTSAQSSPPLPQPNGGTAMELIDFSCTTRTRSASPASMSGSRERAPVILGREVDDEPRPGHRAGVPDVHLTEADL
ncbi:MAG: hypothetical protein ACRDTD_24280, partial [Pseudonocardiaceae bacterium]